MHSGHLEENALAECLLELALKAGAEAAEVLQSRSWSRPVYFEANRLKQMESAQAEGTALRLWYQGRPGLAVAYGPVEPQAVVERAIALSHLNPPETIELNHKFEPFSSCAPHLGRPKPIGSSEVGREASRFKFEPFSSCAPHLGRPKPIGSSEAGREASRFKSSSYHSPDLGTPVAVEQLIAWGQEAIALVRDSYPEVLCTGEWECESETTRLLNSKGLDCSYTDTTLSGYVTAEWTRGDDLLSISDGQTQRDSLQPEILAHQICQRLDWSQRQVPPCQGYVPVLFTAKAADMLWGTIQAALNGKQVLERASPWSDRLGELVIAEALTLGQDPKAGPYSCPFDDEGTPTRPAVFIQNGVLQLFYADRTIGQQLGSGTTGNGFRPGLDSYPTPGLFNLLVQPGSQSLPSLIATLGDGLIIDQVLGSGAGISGNFSINVDLGYRVQGGTIAGRVKDTMVFGNVYQALKALVALGADADWNGACYTPSLIVEGLSATGRQ